MSSTDKRRNRRRKGKTDEETEEGSSSSSSGDTPSVIPIRQGYGRPLSGEKDFHLPANAPNSIEEFINFREYSFLRRLVFLSLFLTLILPIFSYTLGVFSFVFFKFCSTAFVGEILREHSVGQWMTYIVRRIRPNPSVVMIWLFGKDGFPEELSSAYIAWRGFRRAANWILVHEVESFIVVAMMSLPSFSPFYYHPLQWCVFLVTVFYSVYDKAKWYKADGDYGWFWGDFFFRKPDHAKFKSTNKRADLYTYVLGNAYYYGFVVLTLSQTLLALVIYAQFLHVLFWRLVEVPHLTRTYGDGARTSIQEVWRTWDARNVVSEMSEKQVKQTRNRKKFFVIENTSR